MRYLCFCAAALLAPLSLLAQEDDYKIEPALLSAAAANPNATFPVFVLLEAKANVAAASRIPDKAARGQAVVQALRSKASASQPAVQALLRAQGVPFVSYWVSNAVFVPRANLGTLRALAARTEVTAVKREPVLSIPKLQSVGTAPSGTTDEWNLLKIGAEQVWPVSRGAGITVANLDTGVRYTHQALTRQYRGNLGGTYTHSGNWKDATGVCGAAPCDNAGHGTMVMGIIAGDDGIANHIGVAPDAKWMACKACQDGAACYGSHIMTCAQWILDPLENGSGLNQPDVVNNSWSGAGADVWFMDMVNAWTAAGIFSTFAAGNSGPSCSTTGTPADYPQAFAAGSSEMSDIAMMSSSRGPSGFYGVKPNVVAPGANIRSSSSYMDDLYEWASGTSMASPHVGGAVALVWAAQPALRGKVALTAKLLQDTAVPITTAETCGGTAFQTPNNTYGFGRLDAYRGATTVPLNNDPPVVAITVPAQNKVFPCPGPVTFRATASDVQNGAINGRIRWWESGVQFASGGTATKEYTCSQIGTHNVTAAATDTAGLTGTDTVSIQVKVCKPRGVACSNKSECCSLKCPATTKVCN